MKTLKNYEKKLGKDMFLKSFMQSSGGQSYIKDIKTSTAYSIYNIALV